MKQWETYNIEDIKEKYLLKFLSFDNTIKFLDSGNIWFSRADKFGDKMECVTISDLKLPKPPIKQIESRKRKHLISCWHLSTNESLAMWDTYSADVNKRRVLALQFETAALLKAVTDSRFHNALVTGIKRMIAGKIHYKNLLKNSSDLAQADKVTYVAFRKEYVFNYESEFRFVIQLNNEFLDPGLNYNIGKVTTELPFKILINPLLETHKYLEIKEDILSTKYRDKLGESSLTKWLKPESW